MPSKVPLTPDQWDAVTAFADDVFSRYATAGFYQSRFEVFARNHRRPFRLSDFNPDPKELEALAHRHGLLPPS